MEYRSSVVCGASVQSLLLCRSICLLVIQNGTAEINSIQSIYAAERGCIGKTYWESFWFIDQ